MSELVREALRQYERQRWWDAMNAYGRNTAETAGVRTEEDVVDAIHAMRRDDSGPPRGAAAKNDANDSG